MYGRPNDIMAIEIDGLPRSMYGEPLHGAAFAAANSAAGVGGGGGGASASAAGPSNPEAAVGWAQMFKNSKEYTVLKKVVRLLQDNRLNSGDEEMAQKLQELNRSQNESFPILKSILNGIFITTGVVLLIGVVIVIIITSIGKRLGRCVCIRFCRIMSLFVLLLLADDDVVGI